jgi:hypothetical protein
VGYTYFLCTMSAIEILLRESIDYAGLFPPAALDMDTAVRNYARYQTGYTAWALGRFIVPASRLDQFETSLGQVRGKPGNPWRCAVLLGTDPVADLRQLEAFGRMTTAKVDTVEVKATFERTIGEIVGSLPPGLTAYFEVPIERDPADLIATMRRLGARAKVRTGGVTQDAFPSTADLLRFIHRCTEAGVPFKATAGLHHPMRAEYRLTYAPDSPRGTMFGFLNLLLAVAFIREGMPDTDVMRVLEEGSVDAIQANHDGISWIGNRLSLASLTDSRRQGMVSFGSCSFTEPIEDLESLGLLPTKAQRA